MLIIGVTEPWGQIKYAKEAGRNQKGRSLRLQKKDGPEGRKREEEAVEMLSLLLAW